MTTVRFKDGEYQMWDEVTDSYWTVSKEKALDALSNADTLVFNHWQTDTLETINKFRDISHRLPVPFLEIVAPRRVGKSTLIKTVTAGNIGHLVIGSPLPHNTKGYNNYISASMLAPEVLKLFQHVEEVWLDDVVLTATQLDLIKLIVKPKSIIQIYTRTKEA